MKKNWTRYDHIMNSFMLTVIAFFVAVFIAGVGYKIIWPITKFLFW